MIDVRALARDEIKARLDEIASLRTALLREWPCLQESHVEYERAYLQPHIQMARASVIGAFENGHIIGISTALPLEEQSLALTEAFADRPEPLDSIFMGGEPLLLPRYRKRGIGTRFLALNEARALSLGRSRMAFCAVSRPSNHPLQPANLDDPAAFWSKRGYAPVPGVVVRMEWRDIDQRDDAIHSLPIWMKDLS